MARHIGYIYAKQPLVDNCCPSPDTCYCDGDMIHHGDFYDSVSPSENIWKKFELLPTPPLSPQRDNNECSTTCLPSRKPSGTVEEDWLTTMTICFDNNKSSSDRLKSKLIQDCMWSGSDELETRSIRTRTVSLSELTMMATSTSCVDPTTVFPQPLNQEHSYSLTTPEPTRAPCTPAPTDSESEEVDVVTVESSRVMKMAASVRRVPGQGHPRITATTIITHGHNSGRVKHNLNAVAARLNKESNKRPKCISPDYTFCIPATKRRKYGSQQSSRSSSDSEEFSGEGKRSQHNVLERKRRNDLKSSFMRLRDQLPCLQTQERAPKVTILSNATGYVHDLRLTERRLAAEMRELRDKNTSLKRLIEQLQTC